MICARFTRVNLPAFAFALTDVAVSDLAAGTVRCLGAF